MGIFSPFHEYLTFSFNDYAPLWVPFAITGSMNGPIIYGDTKVGDVNLSRLISGWDDEPITEAALARLHSTIESLVEYVELFANNYALPDGQPQNKILKDGSIVSLIKEDGEVVIEFRCGYVIDYETNPIDLLAHDLTLHSEVVSEGIRGNGSTNSFEHDFDHNGQSRGDNVREVDEMANSIVEELWSRNTLPDGTRIVAIPELRSYEFSISFKKVGHTSELTLRLWDGFDDSKGYKFCYPSLQKCTIGKRSESRLSDATADDVSVALHCFGMCDDFLKNQDY